MTADVDVFLSGLLFYDLVFTGLEGAPKLGTETWTTGMASGPGGIANFAVTLGRLGLRTSLAAAFGDDSYGRYCWDTLESEGVDLSPSRRLTGWSTPVTVSLAYQGDRALVTHGAEPPGGPEGLLGEPPQARASIVHLGTGPARGSGLIFADLGWDPSQEWSPEMLDQLAGCHAFMPNAYEAMSYTRTDTPEAALAKLAELVPLAVVTCGVDGVLAVDATTGESARVPGLSVDAIDPTGAGDVFGASLVAGTLAGWPLADRLRFANLSAALSVQGIGGSLAAPGWAGIARWWHDVTDPDLRRAHAFLSDVIPD
ncbi:carbohydrate kinase family protein [Planotetraspora mira]|uniref:Carbohydrate kinase n=1 Tax=Planotetraspora mira TaxID=58121 RepID=A0A8J3TTT6_9ACTN|nr:carbohydrate kinase family protein [Planotetraspora mira]GII30374.1 carbohydrate kinase [Planotetraspora mira]